MKRNMNLTKATLFALALTLGFSAMGFAGEAPNLSGVRYKSEKIEGLDIFYREAGDPTQPTLLLLHGFPTSSHMFRNLILALSDRYHVISPDYPGYGNSSAPSVDEFDYTFDNVARIVEAFTEALELDA
jgi:pimeloyl-ACP methyl ester carboxylesterase